MPSRIRRWLAAEWPLALVVGGIAAAVVYLLIEPGHWRRGVGVISVALIAGAVLRAVIPPMRVGMLAVRGRVVDTVALAVLGGVILTVAIRLQYA